MDHPPDPKSSALTESLRQSEERFRLLVESISDYAIFMLDPDGHVLTWNTGARRIKGYAADEIIGRHFSTFYPPDANARQWPQYELQVAAQEGRFEDENWRLRKDGSRFWANVVITALRDPEGTLVGFAKVTRDLSERKQHEERLRESEERFRLLVEGVIDYAIFRLDADGRVASWNRGAERMKGYRADEIIGQHFSRFYPPADIAAGKPEEELRRAIQDGRVEDEGWRLRKDGTRFWANVVITAIYDAAGNHRGFAKVTRDMTERRRVEQLELSEQRMNEFLAMLAHELRNPLAPIRNAVGVMQLSGNTDTTTSWSRDIIDRQVRLLTRLVDDLLDISRIRSGKITLRRERVDLRDIITRAVEVARPLIDARRHQLAISVGDKPLTVDADETRLAQVVVNLLNNAAKYTPEGGHIWLSLQRDGDQVAITVRDNGIGIPDHLLPRIFDLFAQGDRSLARSEGGLGLGLTLARRLVEMHEGTIVARSEGHNLGSEFVVRLRLAAKSQRQPDADVLPQAGLPAAVRRVLVVDDHEDSAQTMAMLLELGGHETRVARDGLSALALAGEFRPHAVLMDIGLPEMDGFEVAARLRRMPEIEGVTLIAVTGYGQPDDRRRSADAGFSHHLVKPVDPAVLERLISAISIA